VKWIAPLRQNDIQQGGFVSQFAKLKHPEQNVGNHRNTSLAVA
jgi:hypothetical protein